MLSPIFAFTLLDSSVVGVMNSPFVVPVAGCAMIGSIVVARIWSGVRTREIQSAERLARIAQGLPLEPEWDPAALRQGGLDAAASPAPTQAPGRLNDGSGARRAGLILCSIGLGLIGFFFFLALAVRTPEVLSGAAAGIIPLAIGIGFLVDGMLRRRDYERWHAAASYPTPQLPLEFTTSGFPPPPPMSTDFGNVPPPPHPELTRTEFSDLRPLH